MFFQENKMAKTLKDHEEVCSIRYASIESRLTSVEKKIDEIRHEIDGFKTFLIQIALKSGLGVFALVCGAIFVIKL